MAFFIFWVRLLLLLSSRKNFSKRVIGRLDAAAKTIETIEEWLVGVYVVHICLFWHLYFKAVVDGIDDQSAQPFALQIRGRTHGGAENFASLT